MPSLPNPRHERMVQFLAQGKTAAEAYELAGYKPNGSNACNMARKQHIIPILRKADSLGIPKSPAT
jgi:phage terminase small subunit